MLYKYSIKKANGTLIVNNKKLDIPSSTRLKEIIKVIYRRHKYLLRLNKSYAFHLSERGDYLHQVALVSFYKSGDKVKVEIHSTGYNNDDIIMYDPLWTDPFGNITPIGVPPLGYLPPVSDPWNLHSFWTPIGGVTQTITPNPPPPGPSLTPKPAPRTSSSSRTSSSPIPPGISVSSGV